MVRGSVENSAEPQFVAVGRITRPHGVQGEVRVELLTDVRERFEGLEAIYIGERRPRRIAIEGVRYHQDVVLLKFAGYSTREESDLLRGELLLVPEDEVVPLEEGEYFLFQLLGLDVITEEGVLLGSVARVLETGANDVLVVSGVDGREILLPDIPDVVREMDLTNRRLTIRLIPGLLD